VYGISSAFMNFDDLNFDMPDEEKLWTARSESQWRQLWDARVCTSRKTMQSVLAVMMAVHHADADMIQNEYQITTFATLIIIHAVCGQLWSGARFMQAIGNSSSTHMFEGLQQHYLMESTVYPILSRCQEFLDRCSGELELIEATASGHSEEALLFNCRAIMRITYMRLISPVHSFHRLTLITSSVAELDGLAEGYAATLQERNVARTKAAIQAASGFTTSISIGYMFVRKTAALSWSVEHAVAAWDSGESKLAQRPL
jgi:hypothetical protein